MAGFQDRFHRPHPCGRARREMELAIIPDWAEEKLAGIGAAPALRALDTLRREMVWPLLHSAKTSDNYDTVGEAVAKLKALDALSVPGSAEALQDFLGRPARRLVQWIHCEEHAESGAMVSWTERVERNSSAFGQRPSP